MRVSQAVYEEVVGKRPGVLSLPPPLSGLPGSLEEVTELSISRNPDILAAVIRIW